MKKRIILMVILLSLLVGCKNSAKAALVAGDSEQITVDDGRITYVLNVVDINRSYIELEITPSYDGDYYYLDNAKIVQGDSLQGHYDIAIMRTDIFSRCTINDEEIDSTPYAGGVFYGVKEAYPILAGNNNPTIIRLYFLHKQTSDDKKISVSLTQMSSPRIITNKSEEDDEKALHVITALRFEITD